ncbi:DUF1671 domain-containing protein [Ophiocordyceps camponoti-floridani]|uniref:DUF1671 domain-containing protein n=1 Tax=Ophiocordyceps camponoti-floridani TaxID=2030778 RepID=A0A8H4Q4H5_9HYPO|nr:DUF1671 domain-containing protein [Ophiocordyceps camponoti-floridani]
MIAHEAITEHHYHGNSGLNQIVKTKQCHQGWSERYQSWIVDDDKVLDAIEGDTEAGGCIIDWHACDLFPQNWIDLIVVLRVNSATLYDRLKSRNYGESKLQENLDSEIMDVLLQEAREAFHEDIVIELISNTSEDMENNVARIEEWIGRWSIDNCTTF